MRVAELMETNVEAVDAAMAAEDAWQRMLTHHLALLVVTRGSEVAGVVMREHLGGPGGRENRRDRTVDAFLPEGPVTLTPECSAQQAADLLEGSAHGCVAVLERGHLVGVLTTSGLLRKVAAPARARRRASSATPHPAAASTPALRSAPIR